MDNVINDTPDRDTPMICSPEKLAANRANGAKSKGPKTEAGKDVSRRNAIKHGLTGEGTALPDEDAAEVEAAFNQQFQEMKPRSRSGAALVFKVALNILRLARFRLAESAILSQRVHDAGYVFDDAQVARRDEAKAKLYQDPVAQLAILSRFEAGARWVIEAWNALGCALSSEQLKNWRQPQYDLFEALTGRSREFPSYDDSTFWNLAAKGDELVLDDREMFAGDSPAARCQDARDKMMEVVEQEIEKWEAILETATASTAIARANAIKAARYDDSKAGLLAKKYEAATTRELFKALKDFKVVEAEFAESAPIVETDEQIETCVELGSFLPEAEPEPERPESGVSQSSATSPYSAQTFQVAGSDRSDSSSAPILGHETGEFRRL